MSVLDDIKNNIVKSNIILSDLGLLIKRLSRIMIAVNVVNIITLLVLFLILFIK